MHEVVEGVENREDRPIEVWIEPWAEGLSLSPGKRLRLVARAPHEGILEMDAEPGRIVVYGWPGSTLMVCDGDGEEVIRDLDIPVPDIPPGMTTKSFVGFMFGGPHPAPPPPMRAKRRWRFW